MGDQEGFRKTSTLIFGSDMMQETIKGSALEHLQIKSGVFQGELMRLELPGLCIDYGNYNLSLIAKGSLQSDRYFIGTLLNVSSLSRFFKTEVKAGDLLFLPPGSELDVMIGHCPEWCTLSFDREFFEKGYRNYIAPDGETNLPRDRVILAAPVARQELLRDVRVLLFSAHDQLLLQNKIQRQLLAENLLELALKGIFDEVKAQRRNEVSPRAYLIERAEDFLNQTQGESTMVAALAQELGVSIRTLEYAFKDIFGITPKRYLTIRRLNLARQTILHNPRTTITEHATNAGYWHLAQFANDYRILFGELPSTTQIKALHTAK